MNRPNQSENFGLKIVSENLTSAAVARPVNISQHQPTRPTVETDLAEKIVAASYLNVAFLNDHLRKYEAALTLPAMVKNALYLAYTIEVKEKAPFNATHLRKYLEKSGIETKAEFRFHSETFDFQNRRVNPIQDKAGQDNRDNGRFCVGSHQDLTIVDLTFIIETFDRFFEQFPVGKKFDA